MTMAKRKAGISAEEYEKAIAERRQDKYVLRLYVTGTTPRSIRAIENIRKICDEHLPNSYELEIIDVYQQPSLLKGEQIIAVPTLIRRLPLPLRKFIGDLSDSEKILLGLDLKKKRI
jgi:circadian clock protein KaiB